jgi:hypothetical protein
VAVSLSQRYMASNPRFTLIKRDPKLATTKKSRPVQRVILYTCLAARPVHSLEELADGCTKRSYQSTFKSETNIRRSILYHLKRMEESGIIRQVS